MVQSRCSRAGLVVLLASLGLAWTAGCLGPLALKEVPPPAPVRPAAPEVKAAPASTLDPREERQLGKDLVRDVEQYFRLLKEKNVEDAAAFVDPQYRAAYQDDLWTFVANYAIESAQVESQQLFPQVDGLMAKVKVGRTLFEKGSVVPKKSEVWMTWTRKDGRWVIRPQEQK
ncbi:MAG: hypothetical protein HZB55_07055 [Deltaproteobacteria bacterium]|nr:hypothetical protein [Deltaproteobacteria bacterium]